MKLYRIKLNKYIEYDTLLNDKKMRTLFNIYKIADKYNFEDLDYYNDY
jgi:hypothetical protein